ncbi:alpha/beta hydrolase [Streptomyces sp. A3M-1-3]|uniref:alpha/beta fold hydrolase n=1 Tax=Streptomyces sp. A3M-1-3 TaxID=2962044 RepID=UPI0020B7576C|nr:alpha/beta hydrolase [Streptomyces sp. A3M-1-3]MCP3818475.1 alpha/beta hydrolase [Streptomyces sp. A3M-1-3]
MKLNVHEHGEGDKVALLIHGGMSDHRTWHAVEGRLVDQGYRVVAPDLRGHGRSDRGEYRPELLADDLVENLPAGADVAIGHSLGGVSLSLAAARLKPKRAVYCDPGFRLGALAAEAFAFMRAMVDEASPESVRLANPRWSAADVEAELAGFALFDRAFLGSVAGFDGDYLPLAPAVPSLVQLADPSLTIDASAAELLRERGFDVTVVAGTGHCIHRDDLDAFMASLKGWI